MGYTPAEAANAIENAANSTPSPSAPPSSPTPTCPPRIKAGAQLNSPNPDTFYSPGAEGYTDYPFMH